MGWLIIYTFGVLVFTIFHVTAAYTVPDEEDDAKIVGGSNAEEGQFPYQIFILYNDTLLCGGSILNERWILTAAHCSVGFERRNMKVVAGTNTIGVGGDYYLVKRNVNHASFDSGTIANDIAMLELEKEIVFSDLVQPIDLPTEDFTKVDYPATLSGWGRVRVGGALPTHLQYITVYVIAQERCPSQPLRPFHTDTNICTLNKVGEGACNGDSGGPLVADGVQIGIVSWGLPCAAGHPDVYTRVYSYLTWIHGNMKA